MSETTKVIRDRFAFLRLMKERRGMASKGGRDDARVVYMQGRGMAPIPMASPDDIGMPGEPDLGLALSPRVKMLLEAASLTNGDRDAEYGPPSVNLGLAGELKKTLRAGMTRNMLPGELEAWDMVLTKMARAATGKAKKDTYVDASAYAAIAGEIALGTV